jgi:hypothetical protein
MPSIADNDKRATVVTQGNYNMLVPWVLMGSYAYNILDKPILSDATYDELCRKLWRRWGDVRHRHKWLIDRGETTCHVILSEDDYPGLCTDAATDKVKEIYDGASGV